MDKHTQTNLNHWNERVAIHAKSKFYDVDGFKAGNSSLLNIETEELAPEVNGKSLLHLMCHFGLDTLSFARLGAQVTGIDFSEEAITLAQQLAKDTNLDANFVQSDIYKLKDNLQGQFDIIYTSYGVLIWLNNYPAWGEIINHFLKPGGIFYIVEFHPFARMFDDEVNKPEYRIRYPYFYSPKPLEFKSEFTYTDGDATLTNEIQYEWSHSLSDITNALTAQSLHIEYLHEFDYAAYQMFPFLEKRDKTFHIPEGMQKLPLMFSLKATKPE